jgi:wobble nucleotide-excising tRNase
VFASAGGEEPGVFRLGDNSSKLVGEIEAAERDLLGKQHKLEGLRETSKQVVDEHNKKRDSLADTIWARRAAIPESLAVRMPGLRGKKLQCLDKVLDAARAHPVAGEHTFSQLAEMADTAFDESIEHRALVPTPPEFEVNEDLLSRLLSTPVVSKHDTPFAQFVERLGISDWADKGREHISAQAGTDPVCPLCQRALTSDIINNLNELFDQDYEEKREAIRAGLATVQQFKEALHAFRDANRQALVEFADEQETSTAFREALAAIQLALSSIEKKEVEPTSVVEYSPIAVSLAALRQLVEDTNRSIEQANHIIASRRDEKPKIIRESWRLFARGGLDDLVTQLLLEEENCKKAMRGLGQSINEQETAVNSSKDQLQLLRESAVDSGPAIQAINQVLEFSQFHSFKLASATTVRDGYRVIRDNGTTANIETLSDGERTFVTFLYYYHQLDSVALDGDTDELVAVIDDPISSLDSEIMFVVSSLIRRLVSSVEQGHHSRVTQVMLMTHSTLFHKQVCSLHNPQPSNEVSFYRIHKLSPDPNRVQALQRQDSVRTSYQELWDEVVTASSNSSANMPWLPNVLRRILESYFSTLGGQENLYMLGDKFPVGEQAIHHALIAWAHSGSHTIIDSTPFAQPTASNQVWLDAFERVFRLADDGVHSGHYQMMVDQARVRT